MDCHFRNLPDFKSSWSSIIDCSKWMENLENDSLSEVTHRGKRILNQMWWSWCYYNEQKLLKNRLFRFFGPPGINIGEM